MSEKTHFRKAFNSPYLSSADIVGPTNLTIKCVRLEADRTKKTKDHFNTAHFAETEIREGEKLKPMILNATNSNFLRLMTGSSFIDDWNDLSVSVFVDSNVRFGRDTVEGLRIGKGQPKTKPELTQDDTDRWTRAVDAYKRDGNLNAVMAHMNVSEANQKAIQEAANVS